MGKTDDGLVGRFVPLQSRMGLCLQIMARKEGVEDADPIEVEFILVCAQVLEKLREFLARGKGPQLFFPDGDPLAHFLIRRVRMLEAWADVASVDTGDDGRVAVRGDLSQAARKGGLG